MRESVASGIRLAVLNITRKHILFRSWTLAVQIDSFDPNIATPSVTACSKSSINLALSALYVWTRWFDVYYQPLNLVRLSKSILSSLHFSFFFFFFHSCEVALSFGLFFFIDSLFRIFYHFLFLRYQIVSNFIVFYNPLLSLFQLCRDDFVSEIFYQLILFLVIILPLF